MSTYLDRSVSPQHVIGVPLVPRAVARVALATLVMVLAVVVVLVIASQAGLPLDRSPSTPGVVVTPHPQPAGY